MAAAIALRGDCDAGRLRALAKQSDDANQTRRLVALATIYDGSSRGEAAKRWPGSACRRFAIGRCASTARGRVRW